MYSQKKKFTKTKNMKKSFIIIAAISCFFGSKSYAQEMVELKMHRVEFGFRFMPTVSNFQMTAYDGGVIAGQATFGYGVGAITAFNFTEHHGIQGEFIYNSLSQKYSDAELQRTLNVQYINIPLLYSLNTGKGDPINLNIVAGPQIGISLGSDITLASGEGADTLQAIVDVKKGDFGFAYGAGLSFSLNSMRTIRLDVGYRGVFGIMNISDDKVAPDANSYRAFDKASIRTNSVYAGITFCF